LISLALQKNAHAFRGRFLLTGFVKNDKGRVSKNLAFIMLQTKSPEILFKRLFFFNI